MQASIHVAFTPPVDYLLRIGDIALILSHRLSEWAGHAPVLEEDLALANMALDLIGQARALLTHAGALEGASHDEDQLAFLREGRDYRNGTLAGLPPRGFRVTGPPNARAGMGSSVCAPACTVSAFPVEVCNARYSPAQAEKNPARVNAASFARLIGRPET